MNKTLCCGGWVGPNGERERCEGCPAAQELGELTERVKRIEERLAGLIEVNHLWDGS